MKKTYTTETLPDILTAADISAYITLSRRRVYELFQMSEQAGGIRNFDIGGSKRVKKDDLLTWIDTQVVKKSQRTG